MTRPGRQPGRILPALERAATLVESSVLVLTLGGMVALAVGQIVLRNAFDVSFYWSDELLRLMVLWLAIAGAVAASREDRHISISLLEHVASEKLRRAAGLVIHLFTACVCGVVSWHAGRFVLTSREFGDILLGVIPAWWLQLVIPLGFGIIAYRYALFCVRDLMGIVGAGREP